MFRILSAVAIAIVFIPFAAAQEPKSESLKEFVQTNASRHAVGLYLQNKKVGWMISELKLGTRGGREVAVETSEMLLKLKAESETSVVTEKELLYYSLEGDGQILYAENRSTNDGKETVHIATPSAKGMTVATTVGGVKTTREVPRLKATLRINQQLTCWFLSNPKIDATFEHWGTSWEDDDIDSKELFTYKGKKSIVWGGVRTDVYILKINMQGAFFEAEMLANGNPIRGKIASILDMRAESEELVKKLDEGGVDMIAASSIKVDRDLGASPLVSHLTLEVEGLQDFEFPSSHRQKIRRENGKVYLELEQDFRKAKGSPLSDAERKKYTSATPTIQSGNEKVKKLAAKIVGGETDPLKKADLIKSWVYKKLRKTMACNSTTTLGVLDNMAGDCTEHTLLFVSLARAAGLPARELTGVAHVDKIFGWHAWAEVHDGHQWVSVDPTWDELYVDATHVVFSHDSQNHSWLNVLGRVSFKAIKVEKKD